MARFFDFSDIYKPVGQLYHEDGFLNFLFEFLSLSYLIYRRGTVMTRLHFFGPSFPARQHPSWPTVTSGQRNLVKLSSICPRKFVTSSARRTRTVPFWEPSWLVWKEAARRRRVWQPTPWEEESVRLRRQRKS